MKPNRFNSIFLSAILSSTIAMGLLVSTASVQAQSSPKVTVFIPFAFQAASAKMPAGLYDIYLVSDHVVVLESPTEHAFVEVNPSDDGPIRTSGRLVFHRYGDLYFLRAVWTAGTKHGVTCPPSSREKKTLRSQNAQPATQMELAFNAGPK